jgi:two-component system KDP operon response regulator KdpE
MTEPGPKVLLVDDEAAIVRAVGAALTARGYRVVTAATGEGALSLAATEEPAVIVLDLGLPDIDGIEVCRRDRGAGGDRWCGCHPVR